MSDELAIRLTFILAGAIRDAPFTLGFSIFVSAVMRMVGGWSK